MALSLLDSRRSKNRSELNSSNRDKPDAFECNGLCRNQWMHSLLTFLTGCWPPFSHRFRPSGRYKNTKKSCQDLASNLVSFLNTRWFHSNHCMDRDMAQGHYADLVFVWPEPSGSHYPRNIFMLQRGWNLHCSATTINNKTMFIRFVVSCKEFRTNRDFQRINHLSGRKMNLRVKLNFTNSL